MGSKSSQNGTQTHRTFVKEFQFCLSHPHSLWNAAVWVLIPLYLLDMNVYEFAGPCVSVFCMCVHSCSYSQRGLPWFQGEVSPIPPISGASLQDVLGSLMLSIVGGTKSLPVSLTTPFPFPFPSVLPSLPFLSSCHSRPFSFTHISSAVFGSPLADGLFTSS